MTGKNTQSKTQRETERTAVMGGSNSPLPPGKLSEGQAYWDANLDVANLESDAEAEVNFERERRFFFGPEGQAAFRALEPIKDQRVLEIGPGLGVASIMMAQMGARVTAVDYAPRRLEAIRALAEREAPPDASMAQIDLREGSAEKLPLSDGAVDLVFTKSVLIHTDLEVALREIRRVLRPGGRAVFLEPMDANPFVNLYRNTLAPKEWKTITHYFTPQQIRIVKRYFPGMKEERYHLLGFSAFIFQYALKAPRLFRVFAAATHLFDQAIFRLIPPLRRYAWFTLMIVEKR